MRREARTRPRGKVNIRLSTLERWFALVLRDGMALTLVRDYEPFPAVAASALRVVGDGELTDVGAREAAGPSEGIRAHSSHTGGSPEAVDAMKALRKRSSTSRWARVTEAGTCWRAWTPARPPKKIMTRSPRR
jgi:hypothetical protein